jgi:hypothetical protein
MKPNSAVFATRDRCRQWRDQNQIGSRASALVAVVLCLVVVSLIPAFAAAQSPWESPAGQACFERWINDSMSRLNSYQGNQEFNARKPWSINRYGILEGNRALGPTSVAAPDNFPQYRNNRYWYMWDYWHAPGGFWKVNEWNAARLPDIRDYVTRCVGGAPPPAGAAPPPTTAGDSGVRCRQYANTGVAQNNENIQRHCGFSGSRWVSDFNTHFNWCVTVAPGIADGETRARENDLARCRTQADPARARCEQYTRTAISQNDENVRRRCGYSGARWHGDHARHLEWCLWAGQNAADNETRIRVDDLRKCGAGPAVVGPGYVGCFRDQQQRDLSGATYGDGRMTIGACRAYCGQRNFAFAGVQYGSQCFCGSTYGRYGGADNCNMACGGSTTETCGGVWANAIYRTGATASPPVAPSPAPGLATGSTMEQNVNRQGSDYRDFNLPAADPALCRDACVQDPRCKAWTYVKPNTVQGPVARCWLKGGVPSPNQNTCCVSGVKR